MYSCLLRYMYIIYIYMYFRVCLYFACSFKEYFILLQSSLQQHVHDLQEENAKLKMTLDKAPKTEHLVKLKEKIGKYSHYILVRC